MSRSALFVSSIAVLVACSSDQSSGGRKPQPGSAPSQEMHEPPPMLPGGEAMTPPPVRPPPVMPMPMDTGACGAGCTEQTVGQGGEGFDLTANPGESVTVDEDGALTVLHSTAEIASYIWIADTNATPPTIAKIDTRTQTIVARYEVAAADPSRTSVALNGDAYVTSRSGMAITKISALGADCSDTDGDGMVTTSTGPSDVLPFGEDDCVLWSRTFDQEIRAVAAQDIPSQSTIEPQVDAPPKITTTPEQHFVWIGASTVGWDESFPQAGVLAPRAYKLDGDTGEILIDTEMPRGAYGFALDGRGILWLTGGAYWLGSLGFIDTNQCVDDATCNVAPCRVTCSETSCPATCDGAVKGNITLEPSDSYGITVDCKQRVWLGSQIKRYDPLAPADQRLTVSTSSSYAAGIAADANGWVWGASDTIVRLDADTMQQTTNITIPEYVHGVAVDIDGKVWGITMGQSAHVITPGATVADNVVTGNAVTGLGGPYTYSDMTGVQQRLAADTAPGVYSQVFEGCASEPTTWRDFRFDADTPSGTRIIFQARTADSVAELEDAVWQPLTGAPSMTNEAALGTALMLAGEAPGKYVEIRIELYTDPGATDRCSDTAAQSPKLKSFALQFSCPLEPDAPG